MWIRAHTCGIRIKSIVPFKNFENNRNATRSFPKGEEKPLLSWFGVVTSGGRIIENGEEDIERCVEDDCECGEARESFGGA